MIVGPQLTNCSKSCVEGKFNCKNTPSKGKAMCLSCFNSVCKAEGCRALALNLCLLCKAQKLALCEGQCGRWARGALCTRCQLVDLNSSYALSGTECPVGPTPPTTLYKKKPPLSKKKLTCSLVGCERPRHVNNLCHGCYANKNASFWKSLQRSKALTKPLQEPKKPCTTSTSDYAGVKTRNSFCSRWFLLNMLLVFISVIIARHEVMIHGLDTKLESLDTKVSVGFEVIKSQLDTVRAELNTKFVVSLETAKQGIESLSTKVMEQFKEVSIRMETSRRDVLYQLGLLSSKLDVMDQKIFNKIANIEVKVNTLETRFGVLSQLIEKCEKEHTTLALRFEGWKDEMGVMYQILEKKLQQSHLTDSERRELLLQDLRHFHRHGIRYSGCYAGNTMIQVDSLGQVWMPVWNITSGEIWDSENQRVATVVRAVAGEEPLGNTMYTVVTQHYSLTITAAHAMVVRADEDWIQIPAKKLAAGMLLKHASGKELMILEVQAKILTQPEVVYNLEIESGSLRPGIVANHIVTGDLLAQTGLSKVYPE